MLFVDYKPGFTDLRDLVRLAIMPVQKLSGLNRMEQMQEEK